jgi:HD-GYP domain-containing protein (c-di-GMP phosphodiesterase class II)
VYDDRGRLSHFEGFLADVTRQKEAADAQARRADEREAFHTLSHNLRAARTSAEMYPIICDEIMALLGGRYAYLSRLDPERGVFVRVHTCGVPLRETGSTFAVGESPSGLVVQSGESHVSPDVALDIPEDAAEFVAHGVGPSAVIPMRTEDGVVGTLGIMRPRGEDAKPFTEAEVRILEGMAEIGGIAIRRAELAESLERRAEEAERRQRELEALNEIQLAIRGSLDLRVMLNVLLDKAMTELQADAIDVLLLDPDTHALRPVAWRGFRNGAMQKVRLRLGEGYAGRVALTAAPMNIDSAEMAGDPAWREPVRAEGFVSYHAVPLVATGSVRGVIEVFRRRAVPPAAEWHRFFGAVAGQAAIAIDNATLFDNLRQANVSLRLSYDQTLEGWSRALDLRDRETEGHSQRVTDLAVALAQAMRVADADLVNIRRGALLHDIGKMGVPDAILLKPGPLTEEEWTAMRRHPAYARQLLAPIAYLRPSLDIPYRHHERWDGTGYPDGLKGVQIPLAARIFAVVDVWDALRSDRPYRPAWSADAAVAHIRDQSGRHFDPAVVEAFLDLVRARERAASGADASVPETAGFA